MPYMINSIIIWSVECERKSHGDYRVQTFMNIVVLNTVKWKWIWWKSIKSFEYLNMSRLKAQQRLSIQLSFEFSIGHSVIRYRLHIVSSIQIWYLRKVDENLSSKYDLNTYRAPIFGCCALPYLRYHLFRQIEIRILLRLRVINTNNP